MRAGSAPRTSRPRRPGPGPVARAGSPAAAVLLAGVAVLGLAACGGGEDEEATVAPDAGAAATTTAAPAASAGADDEATRAGAVVRAYVAAFSAGDGDAVCRLYTAAQRRRIADAARTSCAAGIRTAYAQGGGEDGFTRSLGSLQVGDATVRGRTATVQLVGQGAGSGAPLQVELQRSGRTWRISRPSGRG